MKKSLAKLTFTPIPGVQPGVMPKTGVPFWTATLDCSPNDWSIRCLPTQDAQPDNTIEAEIDFLMENADYLLKKGAKFKLFGGSTGYEWSVEVIREL